MLKARFYVGHMGLSQDAVVDVQVENKAQIESLARNGIWIRDTFYPMIRKVTILPPEKKKVDRQPESAFDDVFHRGLEVVD